MSKKIILYDKEAVKLNRNSSKGNQLKWKSNDLWYKSDQNGYEGLSEFVVSELLGKTNVPLFVSYDLCQIEYNGYVYNGCCSHDFMEENESLITLPRLFQMYLNEDLIGECERLDYTEEDCLRHIVDHVEKITGLSEFGQYLTCMLEMDMLFLNEDRHLHNIAVIYNEKMERYRYCPFFDHGGTLFSDIRMFYPMERSIQECRKVITARPISPSFADQVSAAEALYGKQFVFFFDKKDIMEVTQKALERNIYPPEYIFRIRNILEEQIVLYGQYSLTP